MERLKRQQAADKAALNDASNNVDELSASLADKTRENQQLDKDLTEMTAKRNDVQERNKKLEV